MPSPTIPVQAEPAGGPESPAEPVAAVKTTSQASAPMLPTEVESSPHAESETAHVDEVSSSPEAAAFGSLPVALDRAEPAQLPETEAAPLPETEAAPAVDLPVIAETESAPGEDATAIAEMDNADAEEADELLPATGWQVAYTQTPIPSPSPVMFDPAAVARLQSMVASTVSLFPPGATAANFERPGR